MWRSHKTNSDETRADGNHDNTVLNVLWFTTVYYGILWLAMGLQYSTIVCNDTLWFTMVNSGVVYFTMVTMVTMVYFRSLRGTCGESSALVSGAACCL